MSNEYEERLTKPYKEHLRKTLKTTDDYRGYLDACREEGPETFALAVQDVMEFAATRMREACVAKVREMADAWLRHSISDTDAERRDNLRLSYNVAQNLIEELELIALTADDGRLYNAAVERCTRQVTRMKVNWESGMRWPHQGDLLDELMSRLQSLTLDNMEQEK